MEKENETPWSLVAGESGEGFLKVWMSFHDQNGKTALPLPTFGGKEVPAPRKDRGMTRKVNASNSLCTKLKF